MAKKHESNLTGADVPADTSAHAVARNVAEKTARRDEAIVPGDGVYLSRSRVSQYQREADDKFKDMDSDSRGSRYGGQDATYANMLISEEEILEWGAVITKERQMRNADPVSASGIHRAGEPYEHLCHEGTDTQDPTKDPSPIHDRNNKFDIDRSRSTILITKSHGSQYLNGSAVQHSESVHIELTTPDGRRYADVHLSMDQFASALVSNSHIPCTFYSYWSCEPTNVLLAEVVKEPEPIANRMQQRLWDQIGDVDAAAAKIIEELDSQIEAGKPMGKVQLRQLRRDLDNLKGNMKANANFIVDQALEETSHIAETAAIWIAQNQGLSNTREIAERTPLGSLLLGTKIMKQLPEK